MSNIKNDLEGRYRNLVAHRLKLPSPRALAPRTVEKYARDTKRLRARLRSMPKEQPEQERLRALFTENANRQSSVRGLVAAMVHSTIVKLDEHLLEARAAIDAGDFLSAAKCLFSGEHAHRWVKMIQEAAQENFSLESPARRKSKSAIIGKLPDAWDEKLIDHLRTANHKFWHAVGVLACTGCRPEEIRLQVKVIRLDPKAIRFTINSAKAGMGRPRHIIILEGDRRFSLAADLAQAATIVGLGGDKFELTSRLGDTVRRTGKKLFPSFKENISPYCFRHAMAGDLKASGFSREQVAQALGHTNINTATTYGKTRHGSGSRLLIIESEIPVHGILKVHRLATPGAGEARPDLYPPSSDNSPAPHSTPDDDGPSF